MRVIITGSRAYTRKGTIHMILDGLYAKYGDDLYVIQGGARGADTIAEEWCQKKWPGHSFRHCWTYTAEWDKYEAKNKWRAGHDRNQRMLEEGLLAYPEEDKLVFAFKDDFNWNFDKGGTENMVRIAEEAGIHTFVIQKVSLPLWEE